LTKADKTVTRIAIQMSLKTEGISSLRLPTQDVTQPQTSLPI